MIVATSTDRNFVEMTGVMLRSLAANGGLPNDRVVVFGDRLRDLDRRQLRLAGGNRVEIVDVSDQRSVVAKFRTTLYWPTAVYFRLLVPDLLPDARRLLYLDGDTLINGDIRELATMSLDGHPAAAVADTSDNLAPMNRQIGRPAGTAVFNSGVMIIDIPVWRARNVSTRAFDWLAAHRTLHAFDQDALNAVLDSDWKKLDATYNSHCLPAFDTALIRSARIIHFTGKFKPMEAQCTHPAHDLYLARRAQSPWGDRPLVSPWRRKTRRLWRKAGRLLEKGLRRGT
jgi:lipopolysaccharide biosynthesis glycosyltransferase